MRGTVTRSGTRRYATPCGAPRVLWYNSPMARTRRRKWWFFAFLVVAVVAYATLRGSGPKIARGSWLAVDVDGSYAEGAPDGLLERLIEERKLLVTLLANLEKAAHDNRINGVLLRIGGIESGWAQTSSALSAVCRCGRTRETTHRINEQITKR